MALFLGKYRHKNGTSKTLAVAFRLCRCHLSAGLKMALETRRCRQHGCIRRRYIFADLFWKKSISVHQIEHFSPVLARQLIALA